MDMLGAAGPADLGDVRAANLSVVLRYVRRHTPCSRADIAAATGLSKATVSSLVGDLVDRRLIRETGMVQKRIGRPAAMLALDGSPYAAVGIEVATDHLVSVAVDLTGERLLSWRRSFPGLAAPAGRTEAAVAALAGRVVAKLHRDGREVLGITIAVPGLATAGGGVRFAPHLGWPDLDLQAAVGRGLGRPAYDITVDNNANLAAVAAYRSGPHAGVSDLVVLIGGIDVGAGIIAGGRLVRGASGLSGQVGHLPLDPAGPVCRCGRRGCLEAYAGLSALVQAALPDFRPEVPGAVLGPELEQIAVLARAGDKSVIRAIHGVGTRLGHAVRVVADLLDPRAVVLGGAFATLSPWLLPAVEAEVKARALSLGETGPVELTAAPPGSAAAGGAALALERLEDAPAAVRT